MGRYLEIASRAAKPSPLKPAGFSVCHARMLADACQGLTITPEQLRDELEGDGDLRDLISGALTPRALRMTAETLTLMRYKGG